MELQGGTKYKRNWTGQPRWDHRVARAESGFYRLTIRPTNRAKSVR